MSECGLGKSSSVRLGQTIVNCVHVGDIYRACTLDATASELGEGREAGKL
jgi:hypothetical protein